MLTGLPYRHFLSSSLNVAVGAICSILVQPKGVFAFIPADLSGLAAEHCFRLPANFDREVTQDPAESDALAA